MGSTLEMQDLRYLNLFNKITRIDTRFCFQYNETIFFCVPKKLLSRAIGEKAINIKRMNEILRKRVKIISQPQSIEDVESFIQSIISPVTFKEIELKGDEIILTAGMQNKAALLGRNRRRLLEMQKIISNFFNKGFRII